MTDADLRALAKAARKDHAPRKFRCDWDAAVTIPDGAETDYIAAASPDVVLALLDRIDKLEAALRLYADPDNWRPDSWNVPCEFYGPEADSYADPGAPARAALLGEEA